MSYIRASKYAKMMNLHYRTVIRHFKKNLLDGFIDKTNHIWIKNPIEDNSNNITRNKHNSKRVILYARVSSSINKKSLDGQIERMRLYSAAQGYTIIAEYKEIASGINDSRKMLNQIFDRNDYDILLSEHKDRLTRTGYEYISKLMNKVGIQVEVINQSQTQDDDIIQDFISIITSFCGKIYGSKRKQKTKEIIHKLQLENEQKQ